MAFRSPPDAFQVADQLFHDVMIELPQGLNMLVDSSAGGARAQQKPLPATASSLAALQATGAATKSEPNATLTPTVVAGAASSAIASSPHPETPPPSIAATSKPGEPSADPSPPPSPPPVPLADAVLAPPTPGTTPHTAPPAEAQAAVPRPKAPTMLPSLAESPEPPSQFEPPTTAVDGPPEPPELGPLQADLQAGGNGRGGAAEALGGTGEALGAPVAAASADVSILSLLASARSVCLGLRAQLLYAYLPYDRSVWYRLQSPTAIVLMVIGSWPSWAVRTVFFAALLLLLLPDLDEYQLMQYASARTLPPPPKPARRSHRQLRSSPARFSLSSPLCLCLSQVHNEPQRRSGGLNTHQPQARRGSLPAPGGRSLSPTRARSSRALTASLTRPAPPPLLPLPPHPSSPPTPASAQFVMGLVLALEGFVIFYGCAVLAAPPNCDVAGPGIGLGVGLQAFWQISLQCLTWVAFALLPYSSQCGEVTLLGRQARHAQLQERKRRVAEKREERQRKHDAKVRLARADARAKSKQQAAKAAARGGHVLGGLPRKAAAAAGGAACATTPSSSAEAASARDAVAGGYVALVEEDIAAEARVHDDVGDEDDGDSRRADDDEGDEEAGLGPRTPSVADAAVEASDAASVASEHSAASSRASSKVSSAVSSGPSSTEPRRTDNPSGKPATAASSPSPAAADTEEPAATAAAPGRASGTVANAAPRAAADDEAGGAAAAHTSTCADQLGRALALCAGWTSRQNYAANRLLHLLGWDVVAFGSCAALFGLLLLPLASQRVAAEQAAAAAAAATAAFNRTPPAELGGPTFAGVLFSVGFWGSWRVEISFFLIRLVYALSALPFMIFHVPALRTLLSHTFATGYAPSGACVPADTSGLSSFLAWLEQLLASEPAASLAAAERMKIQAALEEARQCLQPSGVLGGGGVGAPPRLPPKAVSQRKRADLLAVLEALIPRSHSLFPVLFPERQVCGMEPQMCSRVVSPSPLSPSPPLPLQIRPHPPIAPILLPTQICLEYEARVRDDAARKRKSAVTAAKIDDRKTLQTWEEHQAAKYGLDSWQKDSETTLCTLCENPFNIWRRRHHCRSCGRLVCDACSRSRRVPHGSGHARVERACDRCAQEDEDEDDQQQEGAPAPQ